MKRFLPKDWGDIFEGAITAIGLYAGLAYTIGPQTWRSASAYAYVNQVGHDQLGMQVIGALLFAGAALVLGARALRPRPTSLRRVGHAISTGTYFVLAVATFSAIFGPSMTGVIWTSFALLALMHFYYGTHEPSLREVRRDRRSRREG